MADELVTCTFVRTGKKMEEQPWYECLTCKVARVGICVSCKDVCHAGHKLSPVKGGKFFCDCGVGGFKVKNGLCKCLTPTPKVVEQEPTTTTTGATVVVATPSVPKPSDAELTKIISSLKMGFVNPLSSAIQRKDVSSMTNWKNQISGKFTEFQNNYSQFIGESTLISTFITETQALLTTADTMIQSVLIQKEIDAQSKDILTYAKNLASAIDSKNISSVKHNYGFLLPKYQVFLEKFGTNPLASPVIDTVSAVQMKYETEFSMIMIEKEIEEEITKNLKPMTGYLEHAIKTNNVKSALTWLNNINIKLPIFQSKYSSFPSSHGFINYANQVLLKADETLSVIIAEKEIEDGIKQMTPIYKALQGAVSRRDSKSAINWINQLTIRLDQFKSKYYAYPQSNRFIQEATELLSHASSDFYDIIQEENITKALNDIKPKVQALKGALERKDVKSTANWKNQVTIKLASFELEFNSNPLAQTIIQNTKDLLNRVEVELGQVLIEAEVEEQIKIMDPMIKALNGAYSRKDIDSIIKWRNQLTSILNSFTTKFQSNSLTQGFINSTNTQIQKISTELGPIILEKEVGDRILIFKPLISSLRGSFERKDIPAIISKKRQLENQYNEFSKLFPTSLSNSSIVEMNQLFGTIDQSLGSTIAEKEIELQISTMTITFKALSGALDRQDALSAANWKNRLEAQLGPFEVKYQSFSQSTRFIQESKDLLAKVEETLGQDMLNQLNNQLSKLSLQSSKFDINSPMVVGETGADGKVGEAGDAVEDGQVECVNKSNPKPKLKQQLFICITCSVQDSSVCAACRDVCHAGHKMGPSQSLTASCNCQRFESENGPCQCVEFRQFPRQEYQPSEWVKELGCASDDDVKFITFCFKYLNTIEEIFKNLDDDNKERDLKRVASLMEGIYEIAAKIPVDIQNGPLKSLMETVIKPAFSGNNQKLVPEFWSDLMDECAKSFSGSKTLKDKASDQEKSLWTRIVFLQKYRLHEWGFIQSTPKGRALFKKYNDHHLANLAKVQNPIPWTKVIPTEQEKQQVDEFWAQYCTITCDDVPQLSKLPQLETLLKEAEAKLSGIRYFFEFKCYASDYISWLKHIEDTKGTCPTHLPITYTGQGGMFSWDCCSEKTLYSLYLKEWDTMFACLKQFQKLYPSTPNTSKNPHEQEKFNRCSTQAKDFYEVSTDEIKSFTFPLILKWEAKGKLNKTTDLIKLLEKYLPNDAQYLQVKEKYQEIRTNRSNVLALLTSKDIEFNNILREASTEFQSKKIQNYISQTKPIEHTSLNCTLELIPSISNYKGKEFNFEQFWKKDPECTKPFETSAGNYKLTWGDDISGGKDFEESQKISTELSVLCHNKFNVSTDLSKSGSDKLYEYLVNRSRVSKSGSKMWSAVGTCKGLHQFTTFHSYTHHDADYLVLLPPGGKILNVDKRSNSYTTRYEYIGSFRVENRTVNYTYTVNYSLDKVAAEFDIKALKCELFSSLSGQNNSLTGIHSKLRSILPK